MLMKRMIYLLFLAFLMAGCLGSGSKENVTLTKTLTPTPAYTITVKQVPNLTVTGLHSFVYGKHGNELLIIGGRTNGYHGTDASDPSSTFPASMANDKIRVINYLTGDEWTADVPAAVKEQFTSTNAQFYQQDNSLFIAGGYGINAQNEHETFPTLSAVNVSEMITAVKGGNTAAIASNVTSITDEGFRVTGGEMLKIDDHYFLVFGQNFVGTYTQATTGVYTNEIREFSISYDNGSLSAQLTNTYRDGDLPDSTTRFHRRDLNVVPQIMGDGSEGIAVYGGVFTQKVNGAFVNPVIIQKESGQVKTDILNFEQRMSQYACANVTLYDEDSESMFTTLLGGISYYHYNAAGDLVANPEMPWVKTITTYVRKADGSYEEHIQGSAYNVSLPKFIGGESKFLAIDGLAYGDSKEILDFKKAAAATNGLIGYMFGGIESPKEQSSSLYPTSAIRNVYEVYLKKTSD